MSRGIEIDGDIFHLNDDNNLHRLDGPAIEFKSGAEWWMQLGKLHRDNGPAIIKKLERKKIFEYYLDGEKAEPDEIKNIKRNKWIDKSL